MRIMHVLEATLGGTRRYVNDIFLASQPEDEHLIVYATARADGAFRTMLAAMIAANWQAEELDMRRAVNIVRDARCARELRRSVARFQPDVIHAHSSKGGALARIAVFGMSARPSIVYSPNAIAVRFGFIYEMIERMLGSQTQIFAAISPSEQAELQALQLVPFDRVRVILPTVNIDEFRPADRAVARATLGLPDVPLVLGIGRLTQQKDPLAFVRVVEAVRKQRADARGIWVGDGELRGEFEAAIAAANLGDAISVAGWKDDVRPYLAACDVFLSTAAYESFGYVTAEALAMDRPAVASAISGTIDILTLDRDRVLYEPGDDDAAAAKIVALLDDVQLARSVAARGRARVLDVFSPGATRASASDAYRAAIALRDPVLQ